MGIAHYAPVSAARKIKEILRKIVKLIMSWHVVFHSRSLLFIHR